MTPELTRWRIAEPEDARIIARQRACMFLEMARITEDGVPELLNASTSCLQQALTDGTYRGWLAESASGEVVAGTGVLLRPLLPRPDALRGPEAVVLNVYVEPAYRRRGLARTLMVALLDWCRQERIPRIVLHPSSAGQPLYESLGFTPTGEMVYRGK
jgi:GNAT superfamily N-acetyltransferase